jgi:hypothetical protein
VDALQARIFGRIAGQTPNKAGQKWLERRRAPDGALQKVRADAVIASVEEDLVMETHFATAFPVIEAQQHAAEVLRTCACSHQTSDSLGTL